MRRRGMRAFCIVFPSRKGNAGAFPIGFGILRFASGLLGLRGAAAGIMGACFTGWAADELWDLGI